MPLTLPERVEGPGDLVLRRWLPDDAEALGTAVRASVEHLRPWMEWIGDEPVSTERRRARLEQWEREWRAGGDVYMGVFLAGHVVGGCGLHRRIASDGLELGYWIHPDFTGRGLATAVARLLTDAALRLTDVTHVEIHHDKANVASSGVPRKLGFELVEEREDGIVAPAEVGVELVWRMDEQRWSELARAAYLDAVLIGGPEQRAVVIVDYDPEWPQRFEAERQRITTALGKHAVRVEHIGSTAVPGLAAKPVVDVLVTVRDPDDDDELVPRMEAAGYELRVRERGHRMFRTPGRDVHVHVWRDADPEAERYLRFRDRLRESAEDRRAYEELKRKLAGREWADLNEYADAKRPLIDAILSAR